MDLNILISTIITSTSALVAIIGGFLVSRVITLSGEKNAIIRRLREIDNELIAKKEMLDRVELILLEEDVDDFIADHAEEILMRKKPIKEILEEDNSVDLTEDELKPYIEKLSAICENLVDMIARTGEDYTLPNNFDDFAKDNGIKVDERKDWYEIVYQIILNNLPKQPSPSFFGRMNLFPSIEVPVFPKLGSSVTAQIHHDRIKERNNLENEVRILAGIKKEQGKILKDYSKVSGLWEGLAVLIYACVAGIAIPSTLLPYQLNTYDDTATKHLLLILFLSELVVLFVYLGLSIYKLTKKD